MSEHMYTIALQRLCWQSRMAANESNYCAAATALTDGTSLLITACAHCSSFVATDSVTSSLAIGAPAAVPTLWWLLPWIASGALLTLSVATSCAAEPFCRGRDSDGARSGLNASAGSVALPVAALASALRLLAWLLAGGSAAAAAPAAGCSASAVVLAPSALAPDFGEAGAAAGAAAGAFAEDEAVLVEGPASSSLSGSYSRVRSTRLNVGCPPAFDSSCPASSSSE